VGTNGFCGLRSPLPKIRQLDEESPLTMVYMKDHWQGQAVTTARQLGVLIEEEGGLCF
jgi:hypothetical protein